MTQVEVEPKIRILVALANADNPLQASEIASIAGVSKQVAGYWLPILVANGLALPIQTFRTKKYVIQPALVEFDWTPRKVQEMMEPLVRDADLSHVEDRDDAVLNIAHMALELYGEYLEDEEEQDNGDNGDNGDSQKGS